MALTISLVDYSPLYNALAAQRSAGQLVVQGKALELRQKDISRQSIADLLQLASEAAKTVYGIFEQGALEKTKRQVIENETWYSQQIQKGLFDNTVTFKDGELIIPDELRAEYDSRQAAIEKQVQGYPKVQAWASDQGAQIKQRGILHAMSVAEPIARASREALGKETLTMALDQSVAQGKLDPYYAAVAGQTWRTDEQTALLRQLGEQDFDFRTREGGIRNLVSIEGYDAGATAVEAWRKSGEVTSEQADSLLTTAANQGRVQGVVFAQQAQAAYQKMIGAGVDAEAAVKMVVKGIPEAYRSQTEELLRAAKETAETRADTTADEKMQDFYKGHRQDPAGLRAFLDLPGNGFSKAMKRETYMYWDAVTEAVLKKTEPEPPMGPGEKAAWGLFYDPMKTDTMVGTGIQKMVNAGFLDPTLAPEILSKMSQRKNFMNPIVLSGVNVISSTFDLMAEKEKDPTKRSAIQLAQRDALMNLDKYLGEGPHTEAQVSGAVQAFLKPYKADLLKSDWWNPATRTEVDVIREQAWQGRYISPDQQAAFERYDRDMLESVYGVGKTPGTAILNVADATIPSDQTSPGASYFKMYLVTGLNPKHPRDAFYYTFQTDPATRTERLMVLEEVKNAQGQTIGANWMPAAFVKTLTQERAAKVKEAAGAAAAKGVTGPQAVASIAAAAGVKPSELTAAELKQVPTGTLPGEIEATPAQVNKVLAFLKAKTSVTLAEIRKAAEQIGLTEGKLAEVATQRGIKVVQ